MQSPQYPQYPGAGPAEPPRAAPVAPASPASGEALLAQAIQSWQTGDLLGSCRQALAAAVALSGGPTSTALPHALRQAALALCEFGLAAEALPLARASVHYLEREQLHEPLSACLSCLGHVHARLGELDQAELLHMRALSLARESIDSADRMRAYTNLLVSMAAAHEQALDRGDEEGRVMARLALRRAERQLGGARSLAQDGRLHAVFQGVLKLAVAHLLVLLHRLDEAEVLLNQLLAQWSVDDRTRYWRWSAEETLADLLNRRGRHAEAWHLLALLLAEPDLQINVQLHGSVLRQALRSLRAMDGPQTQARIRELEMQRQQWEQRCAQAATQAREALAQELLQLDPWLRSVLRGAD
ncbi:hypothetical protein H5407_02810 [Mitsuaria sp. WAJ17]|uniref:hypothetical protein n=1 Tax=Mitsuaria sp. WAJ17 TaxID=2761452 RepID=UPI0015FEE0E5|nr:hypothetical protein [Mitsuaria sp. WAJ17]MBB2484150.1 hypothetical protein [Mitsuaria sp. WAJ17]